MKILDKGKTIIIAGGVLVAVLVGIVYFLFRIGAVYKSGLENFTDQEEISDVTHTEKEQIRKIIINNTSDSGCMEVTPDGVVRFFSVCEKELSSAQRITDTRYILRLYKTVAETDLTDVPVIQEKGCEGIVMTVETDTERRSVCLTPSDEGLSSGGNGTSGGGGSLNDQIDTIITIIDQIKDNIPPTPTLPIATMSPTSGPITTTTITPTSTAFPSWGISPTPTGGVSQSFTCDYIDSAGKKRPYTISNIICSTEPSLAPVQGQ